MRLNHKQGQAGEDRALAFLQAQGCRLLARNWHCPFGEIDLVMKQGGTLLFVEVKYRSGSGFGGAAASIGAAKLGKLTRSAQYYLQQHDLHDADCRLDAVLIQGEGEPVWLQNLTG